MTKRAITLALAMALCAAAVSGAGAYAAEEELLAAVQEKGTLTIAMEGTWAPWTYHDENDELTGFDVEVGRYIAEYLCVEPEFIEGEWDGLFAGMDSGRYDLVINGVDVTDERGEKYDFSDPYAYIRTALVVREDNEDIASFEDLDGKVTSNSIGSTYMDLAEQYGATVEGVDSLGETMQMVESGRADATLNAEVSVLDYLNRQPDAPLKIVAYTDEANLVAIPMRKGDETTTLRRAVNEAIAAMRKDGTLAALSEKYFGADITEK